MSTRPFRSYQPPRCVNSMSPPAQALRSLDLDTGMNVHLPYSHPATHSPIGAPYTKIFRAAEQNTCLCPLHLSIWRLNSVSQAMSSIVKSWCCRFSFLMPSFYVWFVSSTCTASLRSSLLLPCIFHWPTKSATVNYTKQSYSRLQHLHVLLCLIFKLYIMLCI